MINYRNCPMFIIFGLMLSTAAESVGGCYVYPTSVVVTVGENVLLTCSTNEGSYISSWHIQIDLKRKLTVYAVPGSTRFGTVAEILAKGYFVTHPANNETTLYMNETNLSQAGLYICTCSDASRDTAATTVVVLDSEPKFKTINSAADGEPVTFSCSMSFNASSDVSCELKIEDASGFTVTKENYAIVNGGLVVCNLNHTIIANASSDQWFACNVTLNTEGYIIYSKLLNAIVEWQPTSSTAEALSSGKSPGGAETLAIGLPIVTAVVVVIIIIIGVVVYFIRSRNGGKISTPPPSMGQPTEHSSNCPQRPAANRYDKKTIGGPIPKAPATSCNKAAQQDNKSLKDNELTLCENDLYAATSKLLDPSDGYYAEEVVYNEIK